MTQYISGEDIEAFCGSCPQRKRKLSVHTGRRYDYCQSFSSPVFKCMGHCLAEKEAGFLWVRKLDSDKVRVSQTRLEGFNDISQ